ncbi:MAG: RNA-binding protein [Gloeobacteraceae cyanobacterium ES-bin-316]|nr:RNA-binding protein [Ferruginibacter sp.]
MNIYVSNLGFKVTDQDLKELFTTYGPVSSAKVITDRMTNQSRGFGFVEMDDEASAKRAISELDGTTADGRTLKAVEAKPREERPRSNNGW